MWAWDRITASMSDDAKGMLLFRSRDSWRLPWYSPQSRRNLLPPVSKWCMDPVTVLAAPQNVIFTIIQYTMTRRLLFLIAIILPVFAQKKPVTLESLKAMRGSAAVSMDGPPTWAP